MARTCSACRQITYDVAQLMDEGEGDMEASAAKLFASKTAEWVTREALQIHGGMGYAEESAGQPLLCRCAGAVHFRGRRGDPGPESDYPFTGGKRSLRSPTMSLSCR